MSTVDSAWITDRLREVPGVLTAFVVSDDGLLAEEAPGLSRDAADPWAAAASGINAAAQQMVQCSGGSLSTRTRTIIDDGHSSHQIVQRAGEHTTIVVHVSYAADMGIVSTTLEGIVQRLGSALGTGQRST
ncbi:roadblock/LC7 domain-containing protein [Saccharopolyspora cebuensis]|uniref:Roadblock/LC7 domain-containing protein n=1 Tax=Saccharopolyspora cebuensis TaxID=418759 RepID=A0ABV4CQX7_9PSEU